jgi:hypothetical protein
MISVIKTKVIATIVDYIASLTAFNVLQRNMLKPRYVLGTCATHMYAELRHYRIISDHLQFQVKLFITISPQPVQHY